MKRSADGVFLDEPVRKKQKVEKKLRMNQLGKVTADLHALFNSCKEARSLSTTIARIVFGDQVTGTYYVHIALIKHRCPVLYIQLEQSNFALRISDVDVLVGEIALRYIYTGTIVVPEEIIREDMPIRKQFFTDLLAAGYRLHQAEIVEFCSRISVFIENSNWLSYCQPLAESFQSTLIEDLSELSQDLRYTDTQFEVQDIMFRCHSFIIKARSQYFATLLKWNTESNVIKLDISLNNFAAMMEYIYCGSTVVTEKNAMELLIIANEYLLDDFCQPSQIVITHLTVDNVFDVLSVEHSHSLYKECDYCIEKLEEFVTDDAKSVNNMMVLKSKFDKLDFELKKFVIDSSNIMNLTLDTNRKLVCKTQWVSEVIRASSEYIGWPARNVIGASNTYPRYGGNYPYHLRINSTS
jgi:hypothetical protein